MPTSVLNIKAGLHIGEETEKVTMRTFKFLLLHSVGRTSVESLEGLLDQLKSVRINRHILNSELLAQFHSQMALKLDQFRRSSDMRSAERE